jgi:hypothetical protein
VEPTKTQQYIARAFFPSTPKFSRTIIVNAKSLYNSRSWTPSTILAHELAHTLGFRPEHTRPEAGRASRTTTGVDVPRVNRPGAWARVSLEAPRAPGSDADHLGGTA